MVGAFMWHISLSTLLRKQQNCYTPQFSPIMLTVTECSAVLWAMFDDWQKNVVPLSSTSIESVWRTNVPDGMEEDSSCSLHCDVHDVWLSLFRGGQVMFSWEVCRHHCVLFGKGKPDTWQGKVTASPSNTVREAIAVLIVAGTGAKHSSDKRPPNNIMTLNFHH